MLRAQTAVIAAAAVSDAFVAISAPAATADVAIVVVAANAIAATTYSFYL